MLHELYCRTFQKGFKLASKVMTYREPELLEGENSLARLPARIRQQVNHVLVVTDKGLMTAGLVLPFLEKLTSEGVSFTLYDDTVANPTIQNIEEAYALYNEHSCEGIVAFGGGSPMDCAKGVAACVARPNLTIPQMKGVLKLRKNMPPFFAIPTTSGTGSEATVAAVISDSQTHEKYAIMDPVLVPHVAVLDPLLTVNLPPFVTATTGMDALTHAVEAYIGKSNTAETLRASEEAVQLIFDNLYETYIHPENLQARANMQRASYVAGFAFTRAFVGNVHSIAHTLGGYYGIPHGLANAVLLPYLLNFYGETVHTPLAKLAALVSIGDDHDSDAVRAKKFIEAIQQLNADMNIPTKLKGIQNRDIPVMVKRALAESNPLYPVPKIMNESEMHYIYQLVKE